MEEIRFNCNSNIDRKQPFIWEGSAPIPKSLWLFNLWVSMFLLLALSPRVRGVSHLDLQVNMRTLWQALQKPVWTVGKGKYFFHVPLRLFQNNFFVFGMWFLLFLLFNGYYSACRKAQVAEVQLLEAGRATLHLCVGVMSGLTQAVATLSLTKIQSFFWHCKWAVWKHFPFFLLEKQMLHNGIIVMRNWWCCSFWETSKDADLKALVTRGSDLVGSWAFPGSRGEAPSRKTFLRCCSSLLHASCSWSPEMSGDLAVTSSKQFPPTVRGVGCWLEAFF